MVLWNRYDGDHQVQPPAQAGHLKPAAQDSGPLGFSYLQGWRLSHHPRLPVPVLSCPLSNKMFLCPLPLFLSMGTTEKHLALFAQCFLVCTCIGEIP